MYLHTQNSSLPLQNLTACMKTEPAKISKTLSLFLTSLLIILLSAGMFWFVSPAKEAQANGTSWYNSNWLYRKPITIDNTSNGSNLTNYQVKVSVTYDSHMQADRLVKWLSLNETLLLLF